MSGDGAPPSSTGRHRCRASARELAEIGLALFHERGEGFAGRGLGQHAAKALAFLGHLGLDLGALAGLVQLRRPELDFHALDHTFADGETLHKTLLAIAALAALAGPLGAQGTVATAPTPGTPAACTKARPPGIIVMRSRSTHAATRVVNSGSVPGINTEAWVAGAK